MQESLCEKWFLQHFMDTDAMLPAIDAMDREIWNELPQPALSEAHCFGFLQAALRALILLAVVLTIPSPTFSVIAKAEPPTLAIITFFYSGGRKRWEAVIWLCTAPMLELCATPWGVTMVRWSAFLVCVTLRNTSRRLSISRA